MKKVIAAFLIWRVLTLLVAFFSPSFIPTFGATFPYYDERLVSTGFPHLIWSLGNFDGVHYLGIAKEGYAAQFTQAFFPFYPLLIKMISYLTLGNLFVSAVLISNTAFLAGLLVFYKLLKIYFSGKVSFWSIVFLLSFPTSFFFGSVYTEGLFFFLTVGTFYLAEKNKLFLSALTGTAASATRLIGIFLTTAFIIASRKPQSIRLGMNAKSDYILTRNGSFLHASKLKKTIPRTFSPRKFIKSGKNAQELLYASAVPLGLVAYMTYLGIKFQDPLYFLTSQSAFGQDRSTQSIVLLPQVIFRYLKILATTGGLTFASALFDLICTALAIGLLIYAIKKVKTPWLIFSFVSIILPTLTGTLASMPRYVLVAFPIFIVLAAIKSTIIKLSIIAAFIIIGAISLALFSQGYWVA